MISHKGALKVSLHGKRIRAIIEGLKRIVMSLDEETEVLSRKWMLPILNVLERKESRTNEIMRSMLGIRNKAL